MTTVAACMAEEQIPDHYRQQVEDLWEFLVTDKPQQVIQFERSDVVPEEGAAKGRKTRREIRRQKRAERIAEMYRQEYGISPVVWITLAELIVKAIRWWLGRNG